MKPRQDFVVSDLAFQDASELLDDLGEDTTRFFKHVLFSGAFRPEDNRWVRASWWDELPDARPFDLCQAGLLQSDWKGRWRVPDQIYRTFIYALGTYATESHDLFTGKKTDRIYRSNRYDANRNPYPSLIQEEMEALSRGYFDGSGLRAYLESRTSTGEAVREVIESTDCFSRAHKTHLSPAPNHDPHQLQPPETQRQRICS